MKVGVLQVGDLVGLFNDQQAYLYAGMLEKRVRLVVPGVPGLTLLVKPSEIVRR